MIRNNYKYAIISPCRNEEQYIQKTLDSVLNQTRLPTDWIIVDDGSSDNTPIILKTYAKEHPFIRIVTRKNRGYRKVGQGVIDAFYAGYDSIDINSYDFLCKLDLDLILPPRYFESIIDRMVNNLRIGCCSGKPYYFHKKSGKLVSEYCGDENAVGASKFYRVSCFKQIGGFVREVMWDGIDGHRCRMHGWIACSWDVPDLKIIHLRPMGSSHKGILAGRFRHGYGQYFMGTSAIYMISSAIYRMIRKPYIVGGIAMLCGFIASFITKKPRLEDKNFRDFLRKYQFNCLIMGKKKATAMLNKQQLNFWHPEIVD